MSRTRKLEAFFAAERLRRIVEKVESPPWLTISIGVAGYPSDAEDDEQLISRADQALYKAKVTKNRVCAFDDAEGAGSSSDSHR